MEINKRVDSFLEELSLSNDRERLILFQDGDYIIRIGYNLFDEKTLWFSKEGNQEMRLNLNGNEIQLSIFDFSISEFVKNLTIKNYDIGLSEYDWDSEFE